MSKQSRDKAVRNLNKGVSLIEKGLDAEALETLELAERQARESDMPGIYISVLRTYADLLFSMVQDDAAFEKYKIAAVIDNELATRGYKNFEQRAGIFGNLGIIQEKKGSRDEARTCYEISVQAYDKILGSDMDNMTLRSNAASTLNNLGALLAEDEENEAAQKNFEKALRILRERPELTARATALQFKIATILENIINLETATSSTRVSEEEHKQLVDTYRSIIDIDPTEFYKERLAFALISYADVLNAAGRGPEAKSLYEEAQEIQQQFADENEEYITVMGINEDTSEKEQSYASVGLPVNEEIVCDMGTANVATGSVEETEDMVAQKMCADEDEQYTAEEDFVRAEDILELDASPRLSDDGRPVDMGAVELTTVASTTQEKNEAEAFTSLTEDIKGCAKDRLMDSLHKLQKALEEDPDNARTRADAILVLRELNTVMEEEETSEQKIRDYEHVVRLCELLQNAVPSNMTYGLNLAFALDIRGKMLAELHDDSRALHDLISATDIVLDLLHEDVHDEMYMLSARTIIDDLRQFSTLLSIRRLRATAYIALIDALNRFKEITGGGTIRESSSSGSSVDKDIDNRDMADMLALTGRLLLDEGERTKALEYLEKAAAMYGNLGGEGDHRSKQAATLRSAADILLETKEWGKSLDIYFNLCALEPSVKGHRDKADSIILSMERNPGNAGNRSALIGEYEKLLNAREKLVSIDADLRYLQNMIDLKEELANLLIDGGDISKGLGIYLKLLAFDGKNPQYRLKVMRVLDRSKTSVPEMEDAGQKGRAYETMLQIYEKLAETDAENIYIKKDRVAVMESMAMLLDEQGSMQEARAYYEKALTLCSNLAIKELPGSFWQERTASLGCKLGALLGEMGEVEEARSIFESAFMDYQAILDEDEHNISCQQGVAFILNNLGYFLLEEGELQRAKTLYENALKRYATILEEEPDNMAYRENAACTLNNLGYIFEQMGKEPDALWMYEKAKELSQGQ